MPNCGSKGAATLCAEKAFVIQSFPKHQEDGQ